MLRKHIESAYNEVFEEEQRIRRNPKFEEHRVHVLLYLIDGCSRDGVRDLDLSVMRGLHDRVNIVPILAKGDSYDLAERALMKQKINSALAAKQIRTFNMSSYINNTHSNSNIDQIKPCNSNRDEANPETVTIPFSIIGDSFFPPQVKNAIDPEKEKKTRGRSYPWGFADCDNQLHCDLVILQRVLLDSAWEELREETEDSLYEAYRTEKLLVTTDK